MVLLPMHRSMAEIVPDAIRPLAAGLEANRGLWEGLSGCGDDHAVISPAGQPASELHVRGGEALDPLFDECVVLSTVYNATAFSHCKGNLKQP